MRPVKEYLQEGLCRLGLHRPALRSQTGIWEYYECERWCNKRWAQCMLSLMDKTYHDFPKANPEWARPGRHELRYPRGQ